MLIRTCKSHALHARGSALMPDPAQDLARIQQQGPQWDEIAQRQRVERTDIEDGRMVEATDPHVWVRCAPPASQKSGSSEEQCPGTCVLGTGQAVLWWEGSSSARLCHPLPWLPAVLDALASHAWSDCLCSYSPAQAQRFRCCMPPGAVADVQGCHGGQVHRIGTSDTAESAAASVAGRLPSADWPGKSFARQAGSGAAARRFRGRSSEKLLQPQRRAGASCRRCSRRSSCTACGSATGRRPTTGPTQSPGR